MGHDLAGVNSNTCRENLNRRQHSQRRFDSPRPAAEGDRIPLARPDLIANLPGPMVLLPLASGRTPASLAGRPGSALAWDPMHFVMQQRMLRGMKERAEGRPLVPAWLLAVARIRGSAGRWRGAGQATVCCNATAVAFLLLAPDAYTAFGARFAAAVPPVLKNRIAWE